MTIMIRKQTVALWLLAASAAAPPAALAQGTACRTNLATDAQLIANDLAAIAAQAGDQGFGKAVQTLAKDLEALLPALASTDQQLVEKFLTDLTSATSSSGPGGSSITASEKLVLTNDLTQILVSSGISSSQITTIANDLNAVMASLSGISTAQLQADLQKLVADAKTCKR